MRHFRDELEDLEHKLVDMGRMVESSIHNSVYSLVERNEQMAKEVMWTEALINQQEMDIDDFATRLLALFQPMARDLRFLTSAIKINNDLERMGDLAVNITERSLALMKEPAIRPLIDIPKIAELAKGMVHNALDAFAERDAELARKVLRSDDEVDQLRDAVYDELLEFMQEQSGTIHRAVALMFISQNLERIADHATNIAEDVLFMVKGIDVRHHADATE
jgi:phosphate transport system protein